MKNRIRFAVTALTIILFAACFFVSCSDDVVVSKDNSHSYAEVLESNGAFVYNGQNYETLQGAIDAAAKAEPQARAIDVQKEAITVTGNVKTREVVIPENADILMNLKGFEVSFFDVQANAITLGKNSSFAAINGTFAMADKQEGLVVISAGGENSNVELDSLKINAAGQTALLLDADSTTALSKSVSVEGTVIARGGKANTTLTMENSLSDVKLRGASLIIEGSGSAVITENSGDNEFVVSPTASVIDQTGTIDPKVIEDSICYIVRKGELLTFGSLRESVASLENDNETIVFIDKETTTVAEPFTLSRPATVELNGFSSGENNIILADGANLTITGKAKNAKGTAYPSFAGTITSAEGAVASLVLNSVDMKGSVEISGSLTATASVFNSSLVANSGVSLENSEVTAGLAIGSKNGDIKLTNVTGTAGLIAAVGKGKDVTIDNSGSEAALVLKAIIADDVVAVKGKADLYVTVTEGVVGTFLNAEYATFKDAAVILDKLTSKNTVFEKEILAGEIEDEGSTFKADLSALKGNLVLTGSYLDKVKEITSAAGGNITIVKSSGSIGKIETQAPDTEAESEASGSVVVDNSESEKAIVIGDITAIGDITLTGNNEDATILTVTGSVSGKVFKAESCTFDSTGETATITASTVRVDYSVFADGAKKISKPFYSIETTGKDSKDAYSLAIYSSTGRLGALNAKDGSVVVEEGLSVLVTGSITAKDEIYTTGTKDIYLIVSGDVAGSSLYADYTSVNGNVELSKNLNSGYSYFAGIVTAGTTVTDIDGTIFEKNITANGDITLTGSKFVTENEAKPAITSIAGNILMTKVTGITGALSASAAGMDITIDNAGAGAELTTGDIAADDAVVVIGNKDHNVTVGAVSGTSLFASYAIVTDVIYFGGAILSVDSVFNAAVYADTVTDTRGTFKASVIVKGNATFTDSVFDSDKAVTSQTGDIVLTKTESTAGVTGTVGNLTAAEGSVTINTTAALSTGKIKAEKAVSVKGSSSNNVIVRAYEGASVDALTLNTDYAVVNGTVKLTDDLTSKKSVFNGTINADAVVDEESSFYAAVIAEGDVTLTGSVFFSNASVTSAGNILMTKVTGTAGALKAVDVTINNDKATSTLTTGAIDADSDVSITGDSNKKVTVDGTVDAVSLKIAYATVSGKVTLTENMASAESTFNGAVELDGNLISAGSTFKGSIEADAVVDLGSSFYAAIVAADDVTLTGSVFFSNAPVTSSGSILMTKVTGTAGALTASSVGMDITINNADADAVLTTGAITADDAVSITGESSTVNVSVNGKVKGNTLDAVYVTVNNGYDVEIYGEMSSADSIFNGKVLLDGDLISADSVFNGEVSADTIVDAGSTFSGNFAITADDDIVFENTKFVDSPSVSSEDGDILMTKVKGSVGALAAYDITINNEKATAELTTGAITAENGISVTGAMSFGPGGISYNLTVGGNVEGASLDAVYANFSGGNLTVSGDVIISRSTFNNNQVISLSGIISMTDVSGEVGSLLAFNGGVSIDNVRGFYGNLSTGHITASDAVSVTGNSGHTLTIAGVSASTLDVTYATVTAESNISGDLTASYSSFSGTVEILGNLTSSYSTFSDGAKISANAVVDTNSTIIGDITAENDITFENSVFSVTADIVSKNGDIEMTKTTGEVGTITASTYGRDVTINNALATAPFTTGRVTAGDAVSITGNSDHKLTVAGVSASTLVADFATFSATINAKDDVSLTNSVFAGSADVISSSGSIAMTKVTGSAGNLEAISVNINNAEATGVLSTKLIKTVDAVTVNGNSRNYVTVAGVLSSSLDAVYASFSDDISTSGEVAISESEFTSADADVTSSSDNIILTKVTGTAGSLTAYSVTINNADVQLQSTVETSLTTGVIEAVDAVTVTGNSKHAVKVGGVSGSALDVTYADVTGAVGLTGNLTASYSRFSNTVALSGNLESVNTAFEDNVSAATITAERGSFIRNTNVSSTTSIAATSGDVTLTGSRLSGVAVIAENGKIKMTNVTSEMTVPAGELKASTVTIDNAQATGALWTGTIEAVGGAVTVTGSSSHRVTVAGVTGKTLDAVYTTVTGAVELSGDLTATDSIFLGAVSAAAITAERGEFKGVVTATTGDVVLTGSKFSSSEALVKSTLGNIEMTKVTGTAGALEATNITISNADATAKLVTGEIKAVGAVDLTGNSTYGVTAAGVSGSTLETTYATVTGTVGLSGALTSTDSAFNGNVSATVITDERGTFGNGEDAATITATKGDVTLTGSVFKGSGVTSSEGSILMTKVTGTVGVLEAYSVTINNDQTSTTLTTGAIKSVGAVKVTGNSKYYVTVGGVTGTELKADYAVISGDIEVTTGDVVLTGSKFSEKADVKSTLGNITMTKVTGTAGDLSAYVAVTIDNTNVLGTTETLSTGSIEANDAITLKGNDGHVVTVEKVNGQAALVADYVSVSEETIVYGNLTSSNSTFVGQVSAATIVDTRSVFSGTVYSVGDIGLTGSRFTNAANVLSWTGDIGMTGVSGTAGSLTTYGDTKTITIDNSKSFAALTTGAVRSANAVSGAVKVTGNAYLGAGNLTVGAVSGSTLDIVYATVTGAITASGDVTLTDSVFNTDDGVTSTAGSIVMTRITGEVGNLTASATGKAITINNAEATAGLTTEDIIADNLTVTAKDGYFSADDVSASGSIAINGGTYTGAFAFSGTAASTIEAGTFTGTFSHTGTAALSITGGLFTGTSSAQSLKSGTTTIDGTYSSTNGWNVVFDNLSITGGTTTIKSGSFKAKDADQLNNIGAKINQDTSSDTKFVDIVYTGDTFGTEAKTLTLPSSTYVKNAVINFTKNPSVYANLTFDSYPNTVELIGRIVLLNNSYNVVSVGRALEDASGEAIVRQDSAAGSAANCEQIGSTYTYSYVQL